MQSLFFGGATGGLVGQNYGTIASTTAPTLSSTCTQGAAFSCASGAVSVGSLGQGGGLVGWNDGIIKNVLATGAVTGGAGLPSDQQGNNFQTQLGGLVRVNTADRFRVRDKAVRTGDRHLQPAASSAKTTA
jgi:hypothetical protein